MYDLILALHNFTRWLVLIAAVFVLVRTFAGLRRGGYDALDRTAGMAYAHSLSLQLVFGLVLMFFSPFMQTIWGNLGAAMQTQQLRFFAVEHWVGMVIALVLAHIGTARVRRATTDALKHRQALIFYGLSILVMLLAIPWWRPLFRL